MAKKSPTIYLLIGVIILWIVLAIIFGFFDLQISQSLYDPSADWATFLDDYGEFPGYAVIGIAFIVFLFTLGRREFGRLRVFAIVTILLAIVSPLIYVNVLKLIVYRFRFRALLSDYSNYTPWFASPIYISLSNSTASFPSGHTANAFMLVSLVFLVKDSIWKYPVVITTVGWGILVAYSRIIVGAHYASDVLFSACFSIIITILLYNLCISENNTIADFECPCLDQEACWCKPN